MFSKKVNNLSLKNIKTVVIVILLCFIFFYVSSINESYAIETAQTLPAVEASTGASSGGSGFSVMSAIVTVLGWIAYFFAYVIGLLLSLIIGVLIEVAQYSDIIKVDAVIQGWVVVRDLCNMFFVLILLIIAFAAILRIESYNLKKTLPKLLIMAVLINFSKTICGLIIDFAQVIMLTFVNGFAVSGAGNFVQLFQMDKYLSFQTYEAAQATSNLGTAGAILAGLFAMIVSLITMIVLTVVLVFRIIMLWVYTILSPLAFLLSAFPAGQKYSQQWWSEFSKQVIVGPVLAFFIWLALFTANSSAAKFQFKQAAGTDLTKYELCAGQNELFCSGNFQTYIITIALLIGGLIVTQQLGGMAGAAAGRGLGAIRKMPRLAGKGTLGLTGWGARKFAASKHGFEIRPTKIISGVKEALVQKKRREEQQIESKSAAALREGKLIRGGLGASKDLTEAAAHGFLWHRAWNPLKGDKGERKGVFGQTWQAGHVRKQIKKLEKDKEKAAGDKKEKIDEEIQGLNKELENYKTPYTFYAEQARNAAIKEQQVKIGDNDNADDLIAMFNDAMVRKDKEMAAAIMLTAAKVGHLNEIIQSQKATEDVKNEQGKVVIHKGDYLDESGYGLNALVNQKLIKELGLSEQEAYSHQSQASSSAKSIGHFNLAESIGVKNGLMFQRNVRGAEGQQERARGELRKVDAERAIRNFNRLAWVDEKMKYDEKERKFVRKPRLSDLGKANFVEWADITLKEIGNKRFQKNAAMNIYRAEKENGDLTKFIQDLEDQGITKFRDHLSGEMVEYSEVAEKLLEYGKNVAESEEALGELSKSVMSPGGASAKAEKTKSAETKKADETEPLEMENPELNKPKS